MMVQQVAAQLAKMEIVALRATSQTGPRHKRPAPRLDAGQFVLKSQSSPQADSS